MHTEQCKILLTFRLNAIDVLLILYFTMQAGMSQERKQEQLYPTVLGNATRLLQTLIYLKWLEIYQKHWSSKEERSWGGTSNEPQAAARSRWRADCPRSCWCSPRRARRRRAPPWRPAAPPSQPSSPSSLAPLAHPKPQRITNTPSSSSRTG